jgi:predicted nucleotidyltransferase
MASVTRERATRLLGEHAERLRRNYGVRSLRMFGSFARDDATPASDIDFLVEFDGAPTFKGFMGLKFALEDLLGLRVDLVTPDGLRPWMRSQIEREAIRVA